MGSSKPCFRIMNITITNTSIPRRLNMTWRQDGENSDYVIYQHPVTGMLDILNPVASEIFLYSDGKHTVRDIIDILLSEFQGANESMIMEDIRNFLTHMIAEKVMFIVEGD